MDKRRRLSQLFALDLLSEFVCDTEHKYGHLYHSDGDDDDPVLNWRQYLRQAHGSEHANDYDSDMSSLHYNVDQMDDLDDIVWA